MLFQGLEGVGRVALAAALGYVALVAIVRVSGKRALAKLNAFDLVVTVALGSALGNVALSKEVPVAEGVTAFAVLVLLQLAVSWGSSRSDRFRRLVQAEPTLLLHRGVLLHGALRKERVTRSEVEAAVRAAGLGALEEAEAVVLGTAGDLSVVPRRRPGAYVLKRGRVRPLPGSEAAAPREA